jgi:hypothetical protein
MLVDKLANLISASCQVMNSDISDLGCVQTLCQDGNYGVGSDRGKRTTRYHILLSFQCIYRSASKILGRIPVVVYELIKSALRGWSGKKVSC